MFLKLIAIIAITFASIFVNQSQAWVMQAIYHNIAHPGKCFVNQHLILTPGQKAKSPDGCAVIHCSSSDGHADVTGCGAVMAPENCRWDGYENINADYPLCCVEKFVCKDPADEINAKKLQDHLRDMFKKQITENKN